ncbi:MAG: lytic transglycosylase domain-containing protein [Flavobacteriales bacterium]|nr:lytic transglycosylase domain-containing protein [Flavobacteriales bacterium]
MSKGLLKALKILALITFVASVIGVSWTNAAFKSASDDPDISYREYFNQNYKIFSLSEPEGLLFAEEEVPLQIIDVKEKLDQELLINTYWQSQTLLFHKRANRWFPVIEPILKKNGVPDDFKYLAVIESGLKDVVSPAGATGFWQFLKNTGRDYGLEINNEVDERYHVEKATQAACLYLKEAYEKYGSWSMAAASYNMGISGLDKQVERQRVSNYYDLLLNPETGRYLYRILAIKEILSKPAQYGFHFRPQDLYPPFETKVVKIDSNVNDFAVFAKENGINYKILKILNPWLRDKFLTNSARKEYEIKLPASKAQGLVPWVEQKANSDTLDSESFSE